METSFRYQHDCDRLSPGPSHAGRSPGFRGSEQEPTPAFDVAPFVLPNCPPGEIRFEETRDIEAVDLTLDGPAPGALGLSYLQENWPGTRLESAKDRSQPCQFGWTRVDDWFNGHWKRAKTVVSKQHGGRIRIEFEPLARELPEQNGYDVRFRRTLGLRLEGVKPEAIKQVAVWTRSAPARTALRVTLNAGAQTPGNTIRFDGYNARVQAVHAESGCRWDGESVRWDAAGKPVFTLDVAHMTPAFRYSGDDGHVRFLLNDDSFTISLPSLKAQGPIWFAEKGVFITETSDATTPEQYIARCAGRKTIAQRVKELPEQSYAIAFLGQPQPHSAAWSLGFKNCRQRFWQDPNGDITLESTTVRQLPAADTARYANGDGHGGGHGRFFFGLERWIMQGRGTDAAPALVSNLRPQGRHRDRPDEPGRTAGRPGRGRPHRRRPRPGLPGPLPAQERRRGQASGRNPSRVLLEQRAVAQPLWRQSRDGSLSDWLIPNSPREALSKDGDLIHGTWHDRRVLRARAETIMIAQSEREGLTLTRELAPGETCDLVLKIPFVNLDSPAELDQLRSLDFDAVRQQLAAFWRREDQRGAQIRTPVPQLDALHRSHLTYVQISDPAMPGAADLVNTSVGTSTYSNCGNESCMINQELDQRGLADDARRRLEVWVRYQGTEPLSGRFSDHRGVLHGAGGFSFAASYNQNHGWILWRLAEHALYTRDRAWFEHVSPALIEACDWVFRQRRQTMQSLPHSRGWEHGFLPAGALEDVQEYRYWLTTNTMIWRGVDAAAAALETFGHPEAARVRVESDAYRKDLRRGFETMRQHCPLVRLRSGAGYRITPASSTAAGATSAGFARPWKAPSTCSSAACTNRAAARRSGFSTIIRTTVTCRRPTATRSSTRTTTGSAGAESPSSPTCWPG